MSSYSDVVSLGYRCRTTRRVRDYFRTEEAYPFDWWVSPIKGVIGVLREWDAERLFDPAELIEVRDGERIAYVRHARHGIKFFHDFPADQGYVNPDWRDHLAGAKARTSHLMSKFEALNRTGRKVLFYRELGFMDKASLECCTTLRRMVRRRMPLAQYSFLLISPEGVEAPGWTSLTLSDPGEDPWSGDPAIWDQALSTLGYSLTATEGEPKPRADLSWTTGAPSV